MDLAAVLGAVTQPGVEREAPDSRDPVMAAVFTALLAGLMAPPPPPADGTASESALDDHRALTTAPTPSGGVDPSLAPAAAEGGALLPVPVPPDGEAGPPLLDGVVAPAPVPHVAVAAGPRSPAPQRLLPEAAIVPRAPVPFAASSWPAGDTAPAPPVEPAATALAPTVTVARTATDGPSPTGAPPRFDDRRPTTPAPPAPSLDRVGTTPVVAAAELTTTSDDPGGTSEHKGAEGPNPPDATRHAIGGARPTDVQHPMAPLTAPPEAGGARTLELAIAAQLVDRISSLRHEQNGDYELAIELEPADLGRIDLRVRLEGGVVHVRLAAHTTTTTDLMRQVLPELREALADSGLSAGSLDVGTHTGGQRDDPSQPRGTSAVREPSPAARSAHPPVRSILPRRGGDRAIDVLL